jgi:Immunity protein 21
MGRSESLVVWPVNQMSGGGGMEWIESAGGPLVAVPRDLAAAWRGLESSGHYELATAVDDVELTHVTGTGDPVPVLVLWGEPLSTAFDPSRAALIQWRFAPNADALTEVLRSQWDGATWTPIGKIAARSGWVLFDAAENGDAVAPQDTVSIDLGPGPYDVEVAEFEGSDAAARVVRFAARQPIAS